MSHVYFFSKAPRGVTTFHAASDRGIWRVTRDGCVFAAYWSEGDARRGACLGARRAEAAGGVARVVTSSGTVALRHNEPQFGR